MYPGGNYKQNDEQRFVKPLGSDSSKVICIGQGPEFYRKVNWVIHMQSMLGDRFLKRFAGDLRLRRKHSTSNREEQKQDADEQMVIGSDSQAVDGKRGKDTADCTESAQREQHDS